MSDDTYMPAAIIALAGVLIIGVLWEVLIKRPDRPSTRRDPAVIRELDRHKRRK